MQCPLTPERWQQYHDTGDPAVARHLASCATCRAEDEKLARLQDALASLSVYQVPRTVTQRMAALNTEVGEQSLTCTDTLHLLEAWRDGELDAARAFLVEDHLLGCMPCSEALAQADILTEALRALPALEAPAVIAERIAQARIPWWKRLLPAPAPSLSWTRQFAMASGIAAAMMLLLGSPLRTPPVAHAPQGGPRTVAEQPMIGTGVAEAAVTAVPTVKTPAPRIPRTGNPPAHRKDPDRIIVTDPGYKDPEPPNPVIPEPIIPPKTPVVATNPGTPGGIDKDIPFSAQPSLERQASINELTLIDNARDADVKISLGG